MIQYLTPALAEMIAQLSILGVAIPIGIMIVIGVLKILALCRR